MLSNFGKQKWREGQETHTHSVLRRPSQKTDEIAVISGDTIHCSKIITCNFLPWSDESESLGQQ